MDQGIGIFSSKRFKDPGAMNLKKAIGVVRGLSEEVDKESKDDIASGDEVRRIEEKRRRKTWPAMWKYKYTKKRKRRQHVNQRADTRMNMKRTHEYEIEDGMWPANINDGLTSEVGIGSNYRSLRVHTRSSELKKLA